MKEIFDFLREWPIWSLLMMLAFRPVRINVKIEKAEK